MFDPSISDLNQSNPLATGNSFTPNSSASPTSSSDLRNLGCPATQKGSALSSSQTLNDLSVGVSSDAISDQTQDLTQVWSAFAQSSPSAIRFNSSKSQLNHQFGDTTTGTAANQAVVGTFSQDDLTQNSGTTASDWYDQNLADAELINLTRSLATDGELSRLDMIDIFRNAQDGLEIDAAEVSDLRTIVAESNQFTMTDDVRVLSNKIASPNVANKRSEIGNLVAGSSDTQMENLIGKWFYGGDLPDPDTPKYDWDSVTVSGSLFRDGVSYQDVNQGALSDCYFMAGLAAAAYNSPSAIENMFVDNGDGTFAVRFFKNGVADYVTVNRELPTDSNGALVYGGQGKPYSDESNELWVALAEKAYAQINESGWIGQDGTNSYQGIEYGSSGLAIKHITGLNNTSNPSFNTAEILTAFSAGQMITFSSRDSGTDSNVVANHAYVLLGYDDPSQTFTLFNPWGVSNSHDGGQVQLTLEQIERNFTDWSGTVG